VLGLYGGQDGGIPTTRSRRCRTRRRRKANPASKSTFVLYPDAPHAFHADYRPSYRKEAAEDGWKRCLAWFAQHGVG
jgi:carboxymethylenebutenolidase